MSILIFNALHRRARALVLRLGLALATALSWGPAFAAVIEKPLFELGTPKAPLTLPGDRATFAFKIPVSPRESIKGAQVVLHTVNSTALIKSRSAMTVRLNSIVLGQYPLDPLSSRQVNVINLPGSLLKAGYNDLTVSVVQHYTYDCEDPGSAELWTEIDPVNSKISVLVDGIRANPNPRLSQLSVGFDARSWSPMPVRVVTATESFSPEQLNALSYVSQGVFLRRGKHFPEFTVEGANTSASYTPQGGPFSGLNPELTSASDLIVVGTKSELNRLVSTDITNNITGPYAGIFPAGDGVHFILILSGRDDLEVQTATRAFASPDFVFSDTNQAVIAQNSIPRFKAPTTGFDTPTQFSSFKYVTTSTRGLKAPNISMRFRTPGDFSPAKGKFVTLKLHFSYGAGLKENSSLNIRVNGQFAAAVALNDPTGAEFTKFEVALPSTAVRPGFNTVDFEPVFLAHKQRCDMIRDENMVLTIFDNSTIEVPRIGNPIRIPDMARFSNSLWPHMETGQYAILEAGAGFVTHAMHVMGGLAIKNEGPLESSFSYSVPPLGHTLVIGNYKDFDEKVRAALPLPSRFDWKSKGAASSWMQAQVEQRVVTAMMTPDFRSGINATSMLINKGYWAAMAGEAVVADSATEQLEVIPARASTEFTSKMFEGSRLSDWRTITVVTVALALLLAIAVIRLATQKAQERLARSEEPQP